MRIWVVLPAYNEAENIPAIFDGLRALVRDTYRLEINVILVDDCSTDDTAEVAKRSAGDLPVRVLRNEINLGLDGTFMRGVQAADQLSRTDDIIVCMDADNTHMPSQILRMTRNIQEGRDVVIASRYQYGAVVRGVPLFRRFLSRAMSLLFRTAFPIPGVRDYSCGYRAYRASFLKAALNRHGEKLFSRGGFACMVGILLKLHKQDAICGEVPIVLRYDQKGGYSKMPVFSTVYSTLAILFRERFNLG
ncbi:glycosyltransferase family 2 protein [Accumulibacter sp.]|uniref:glycosyltransferase family 2 protein n=1 Tax=Accumulibacter sp. TaxID=2053492 RepID=UPI0025FED142|nr:glycosyltransferase family 2 protein [Accumulibacter sp.]MCM8595997.1 glycosyltransferase family 2 protein [Accumulibacter sp.]MCM8626619.1 glycosyltransferase family 2 protein [Accumulibacter sp.]MDS4050147.1 glycosyltransferase family 2 protein [Accumulibacter sp.]